MNTRHLFPSVSVALTILAVTTSSVMAQQVLPNGGAAANVAGNTPVGGANPALRAPANPMQPAWFPLNPKHQQYVDQVLAFWEFKSSKVQRYRCQFRRWEYDPVWGPPNTFNKYSEGEIKYAAPDKGLFKVTLMRQYQPPQQPGGKPEYVPVAEEQFERWICDGQWVYHYEHEKKKLVQTQLPPEMRGKAIGKGPLPFLFNSKAEDIKRRFWLRVITPADKAATEYHLEAVPKTQDDAANFKMIHVIIDRSDYLPKAMIVFDPNFKAATPTRTTYEFSNREVNFSVLAEKLNLFHREFFEPAVPRGWQKEVRKWNQPVAPPAAPATTARNPGR